MSSDKEIWALVAANDAHTLVIVTDFLQELNIRYKRNTTRVQVPQQARAMQPLPTFIVLDLDLADYNPFALIKSLQDEPKLKDIPILAIGDAAWETNPELSTAHLAGFVAKPLPPQQFKEAVLNLLPNSNL